MESSVSLARAAVLKEFPYSEPPHLTCISHRHPVALLRWRTHSCVPRRHSCRRPASTGCPSAIWVSRRVSLVWSRYGAHQCVRHPAGPRVRNVRLI